MRVSADCHFSRTNFIAALDSTKILFQICEPPAYFYYKPEQTESIAQRYSVKKVLLKISQNL